MIYKTKYRVTRTPLKTGVELGCSGRISISCSTSDTRRANLVDKKSLKTQLGNRKLPIKKGQTIQWSKEKGQKDKEWLQNTTQKTKDRATSTPLKPGVVSSSSSTCCTHCVTFVTNHVISNVLGKDVIVITTNLIYSWSFVTQIFRNSGDCKNVWRDYFN